MVKYCDCGDQINIFTRTKRHNEIRQDEREDKRYPCQIFSYLYIFDRFQILCLDIENLLFLLVVISILANGSHDLTGKQVDKRAIREQWGGVNRADSDRQESDWYQDFCNGMRKYSGRKKRRGRFLTLCVLQGHTILPTKQVRIGEKRQGERTPLLKGADSRQQQQQVQIGFF